MKKKWTVVLLYPDYSTGDFGADIFVDWARAENVFKATSIVQRKAHRSNPEIPGIDFRPIAVFEGHHMVMASALDF